MDENQVVNNTEKETPVVQPTEPELTEKVTPEIIGAGEKKEPIEPSSIPYSRFQEVNERMKEAEIKLREFEAREREKKLQDLQQQPQITPEVDPYAGMTPEEKTQVQGFIEKFIKPEIRREYSPFIQEFQTERLNKQLVEAKTFASQFGIDLDKRLPEIIGYVARPENRNRLTATEAVRNLYFEEIVEAIRNRTHEQTQQERETLMERKKQANMLSSTVSPSAVVQSDEAAMAKLTPQQRLQAHIKKAIELDKQGIKNPKVRGE